MNPVLLSLALAVGAPQPKEKPKAEPSLVGEWELESRTINGAPMSPFATGAIRYTFTAAGECVISVGPRVPPNRCTFTTDPKSDPAAYTLLHIGSDTVTDGIYKVDGDTLTLCWDRGPEARRPKAFESPAGSKVVLYVFQRVKAKE